MELMSAMIVPGRVASAAPRTNKTLSTIGLVVNSNMRAALRQIATAARSPVNRIGRRKGNAPRLAALPARHPERAAMMASTAQLYAVSRAMLYRLLRGDRRSKDAHRGSFSLWCQEGWIEGQHSWQTLMWAVAGIGTSHAERMRCSKPSRP